MLEIRIKGATICDSRTIEPDSLSCESNPHISSVIAVLTESAVPEGYAGWRRLAWAEHRRLSISALAAYGYMSLISTDDIHYRLLKLLEERPGTSQRQLAESLGISLGKTNYCVKAVIEKGWVKACNFKNSKNKLAYAYLLTPSGIDAKARITARFLKRKIAEYEALKLEIATLMAEVGESESVSEREEG